jgi:hypothetical protein
MSNPSSTPAVFVSLLSELQAVVADKRITLREAWHLLQVFIFRAVNIAQILQLTGPEKRTAVMSAVQTAFAMLWPLVPMPLWLKPFWPFLTLVAKAALDSLVSGSIEFVVQRLRNDPSFPVPQGSEV